MEKYNNNDSELSFGNDSDARSDNGYDSLFGDDEPILDKILYHNRICKMCDNKFNYLVKCDGGRYCVTCCNAYHYECQHYRGQGECRDSVQVKYMEKKYFL